MSSNEQDDLLGLKKHLVTLTTLSDQLERVRSTSSVLLERGNTVSSLFRLPPPTEPASISTAFEHIHQFSRQLQLSDSTEALNVSRKEEEVAWNSSFKEVQEWLSSQLVKRYV